MGLHDEAKLDKKFTRAARREKLQSVISILGHARNTGSRLHLLTTLKEHFHATFDRLPKVC